VSFWAELKRRNVFKVAAAYAVLAWLLLQVTSLLAPALLLPAWTITLVTVLLLIGFPVALLLAWAYELTPDGIKPTAAVQRGEPGVRASGARMNYVLAGLLIVAVGFIAVDRLFLRTSAAGGGEGAAAISRLAVLPCDNLSPDPNDSYFAPGMHEELLNRLAQIGNLRLTSRTSVLQYADTTTRPTIPEIAVVLGVDAIMECSVRYAVDQLLFTAQVIGASDDTHLWSGSYDADMSDLASLFEIQGEIAMSVANAVRIRFFAAEIERIAHPPTESREAYELYLAARSLEIQDLGRAQQLLDQALAIDEKFVDAWLAKSYAHRLRSAVLPPETQKAESERAFAAANRAIELAPDDGRGHAALGTYLWQQQRWLEAERSYRRARELGLAPGYVEGYGLMQLAVGHFDRAREGLEVQLAVDPLNPNTASFLMMTYELLGDDEARARALERGASLYAVWPPGLDQMLIRLADGDKERLRAFSWPIFRPLIAIGVDNIDTPARGLEALRQRYTTGPRNGVALFVMAAWANYFGDPALALEWLEEAGPAGNWARVWHPAFRSVRQDPGFERLAAARGLPEYWDEFGWPPTCERRGDGSFDCD
jgi:TolB-like protein/Tfp pilus assembly protein PilF